MVGALCLRWSTMLIGYVVADGARLGRSVELITQRRSIAN